MEQLHFSSSLSEGLRYFIDGAGYDKLFVLTDTNTHRECLPLLHDSLVELCCTATDVVVAAGDTSKDVATLSHVWQALCDGGASRHSLLINLGGGMITDLGGFAAATFKRGIRFLHIPTTLLGMVDAAVGGKTGINFAGLKNEVGAFAPNWQVLIYAPFLSTLNGENLLSGYAEMLKHGLISTQEHFTEITQYSDGKIFASEAIDTVQLTQWIEHSIAVKQRVVEEDPFEKGIRKALNFGHTAGHAFESLALELGRPVLHGYAVAWGIVCELYLSAVLMNFPEQTLRTTTQFIRDNYGTFPLECKYYDRMYELMTHDKKNENGVVNFTLLRGIGDIALNQTATVKDINEALDFYQWN